MRESGFKAVCEFSGQPTVMLIKDQKKKKRSGPYSTLGFCSAGVYCHQAKTVTNNLPILSVLADRCFITSFSVFQNITRLTV
jgi:hypothetical protein